jgi:hypothetical protein
VIQFLAGMVVGGLLAVVAVALLSAAIYRRFVL